MNIKLNCDMGESFGIYQMGLDEAIMPYIDMANLACGFHASDPVTMHRAISQAKEQGVKIGAHPSYPDLVGFGRREMLCTSEEIVAFMLYQIGALAALCQSYGMKIHYVKPHGALYNTMMQNEVVFRAIAKAIAKYDRDIKLMILSSPKNDHYAMLAHKYGVDLIYEVFADRAYTDEGFLVSRQEQEAVIHNQNDVLNRAKLLFEEGMIETINGNKIPLKADTICVHGDNAAALELIKVLHQLSHEYSYRLY